MKKWKFTFTLVGFLILSFIIIFRLIQFQLINHDFWKALAQGQQRFFLESEADRGEIFITDKNRERHPLAINRKWEYVYISPREINAGDDNPQEVIKFLAETLNIDIGVISRKVNRSHSSFELIKTRLSPEESLSIKNIDFSGIFVREGIVRYFPRNNLASHIVGFLGGSGSGQYGIEGYHNNTLKGDRALQERVKTFGGYFIDRIFGSFEKGEDIFLTIDYNIQFKAESLLRSAQERLDIDGGTILVGDPSTGRIIALANYPDFNPNKFFLEEDFSIFKNDAIQLVYEPGSTFKAITMAIALEEEKITPDTMFNDTGSVRIGGDTIRNFAQRVWGMVDMTTVLGKSINTASVFIAELIGEDLFTEYLDKFGFLNLTGIGLQGEVYSRNLNFKRGYDINLANASFGQGIEVTSMQLFRAFSALANGGRLVNPYIVDRGQDVQMGDRVISERTSLEITTMMVENINYGFSRTARVSGYYVAGKTGTAQVAWSALGIPKRGYSDKTIQSFIGYAPAFNPEFLILVKLDDPKTRTAEYSAAPIFSDLATFIINYYQIPPER